MKFESVSVLTLTPGPAMISMTGPPPVTWRQDLGAAEVDADRALAGARQVDDDRRGHGEARRRQRVDGPAGQRRAQRRFECAGADAWPTLPRSCPR